MLSRAHRTIFVHVPKTAGQSIEAVFLDDLGLDWERRGGLLLRYNADRAAGPERLAHLFAREYVARGHVTEAEFGRYLTFAVVRDPYDRAVSEFNFRAGAGHATLRDFISAIPDDPYDDRWRHVCPQADYVMDCGGEQMLIAELIRFETLAEDWARLSRRVFGAPCALAVRNRSETRLRAAELSRADLDFIAERYEADFRLFGYAMR